MLLYRPPIIDRLPVPLAAAPPNLCRLIRHLHPLCLCLLVSLSPPLIPSVSFSSLSCLLLFLSLPLSLFFFSLPMAAKSKKKKKLYFLVSSFLLLVMLHLCCIQVLLAYSNKEKASAYYLPLQSSALSSSSGFVSVNRSSFDAVLSCFV